MQLRNCATQLFTWLFSLSLHPTPSPTHAMQARKKGDHEDFALIVHVQACLTAGDEGHRLEEELREAMLPYETAATPLGSFPALFQQAMSLGLLSRRRVYAEAQQSLGSLPGFLQRIAGAFRAGLWCMPSGFLCPQSMADPSQQLAAASRALLLVMMHADLAECYCMHEEWL